MKPAVRKIPSNAPVLSDYRFELIDESPHFVLRRGRPVSGGVNILTRTLIGQPANPAHFKWLEHEASLHEQIDAAWGVRPLELTFHEGEHVLVMEDPGGHPLSLSRRDPTDIRDFLQFAIHATAALTEMHRSGLIHKDIKPSNIFTDTGGNVRFTGFSLASRLPRERQAPVPLEVIAGTFAYMAPEQTGRMNRSMDTRSDLYSLGVTFYELLTGQLPFQAKDPLEWVHCHTALQPVPPKERTAVPHKISDIIMKLLAKTADDRFQTAEGLASDLRECQRQLDLNGQIDQFPLGANDASDQLLIPERLYGRDAEIDLLLSAFDRVVANGSPELVLVSGYSGVGKSSVVNELHKVLVPPRGIFASGKFDQYKRDIPYATLAQAFQSLVEQILGKQEEEQNLWRGSLNAALGANGQIIVDLIPELATLIGPQQPVAELSSQDAVTRFQTVFRAFLGVFAKEDHPLALFLDDLQWLDIATLQLLQHLVTHPDVRHVLLVGAYRDNEVNDAHPLLRTIDDIRKTGKPVQDIVLSPLSIDDVGQLIGDALHCDLQVSASLTSLVYEKTGGNPFFVIQFLAELVEKSLVSFQNVTGKWRWDIEQIQSMHFTDNVVDLMTLKLDRLAEAPRVLLQRLACLGNAADFSTLVLVMEQPELKIHKILWEAVHAGLILRNTNSYSFLHDRIQEAAYAQIPEGERPEIHLNIGRLLSSSASPDDTKDQIFEIVNQFTRGIALIDTQEERDNISALFLQAAQQARNSTAYASALNYLIVGKTLLGGGAWKRQYPLAFAIELNTAECEFLLGDFEAANRRIADVIGRGETKVDLAAAYKLRITMHVVMSENPQAVEAALECLQLFDIVMMPHPSLEQVSQAFDDVQRQLAGRKIETLIDLPLANNPEVEAAMSVLSVLWAPAIFTDEPLVGLHVCHMVRLTLEHGVTAASPQGLGWFGIMLGHLNFGRYEDGYKFSRLACDIVSKHKFSAYEAKALYALHMISLWTQPISNVVETIRLVFLACVKTGDVTIACYACNHMVTDRLTRGDHLEEVLRESERSMAFVEKVGYQIVQDFIGCQQRWILQLQGRTNSFASLDGDDFDEALFEQNLTPDSMATMVFWYWIIKGQSRYMAGRFDEAKLALAKARPLYWGSAGHIQVADFQFYSALTLTALDTGSATDPENIDRRARIYDASANLARWARACPATFLVKHALVNAEIARIEGRDSEAMAFYEQGIAEAQHNNFIQYEAIAHELMARFHIANAYPTSGQTCLERARDCYKNWGAHGKVRQLEEAHPLLRSKKSAFSTATTTDSPLGLLDSFAIVKASQAISREIVLDDLVKTLLSIAAEAAGAERGLLILFQKDRFTVVAEATTGNGKLALALRNSAVSRTDLPESGLQHVMKTKESMILDDALSDSDFSNDEYVRLNRSKSILFVPIMKQARVNGVLYFENNLTSHGFTPQRLQLLELLASQAAISLENAGLYTELSRSEAFLAEGQRHSATGTWGWNVQTDELKWSAEHFRLFGFQPDEVKPNFALFLDTVHPEDRAHVRNILGTAVVEAKSFSMEFRASLRNNEIKHFLAVGREMSRNALGVEEYMGTVVDITDRKRDEKALLNAQEDLRRVSQLTIMGELAASISHEINQPLAAMVNNASASLRWMADNKMDIASARKATQRIVSEGHRAGEIIKGIYRLAKKQSPQFMPFDINAMIHDVLSAMRGELELQEVVPQISLYGAYSMVHGDRTQLRQVVLNLVRNSTEAMSAVFERPRVLTLSSVLNSDEKIEITIADTGCGLDVGIAERVFDAFVTTKTEGMGMGLSICRTIIEAHGGALWSSPASTEGAIFQFTLPTSAPKAKDDDANWTEQPSYMQPAV